MADETQIEVVGLFTDQAVIQVNGQEQQYLLKKGQTSPEGIKLLSADSNQAILQVDGKPRTYHLSRQVIAADYDAPSNDSTPVTLWLQNGAYRTTGSINGYVVDFLVDTGASVVALNAETAKRLDIDYEQGQPVDIKTASGKGKAHRVTLDTVQVGDITVNNIEAVVTDGPEPSSVLLGMTFLDHLDIEHDGNKLQLKQKF